MRIWCLRFQAGLGLTMATFALASLAAVSSVPDTLDHRSMWIVNVNGSVFSAQLQRDESHEASPSVIEGKLFVRLKGGRGWKGDLEVSLGEMGGSARLGLPDSEGRSLACQGTLARDGAFLAGTCDQAVPFMMVPSTLMQRAESVRNLSTEVERCQEELQTQRAEHTRHRVDQFKQCQAKLRTQRLELGNQCAGQTATSRGQIDANLIARNATSTIPFRTQGGGCETCDSVNILDVPRDPPRNSDEGRWLNRLLKAQDDTIFALFDTTGINLLSSEESAVCRKSRTCSALFRQSSIAAAADLLGDRQ